MQFSADEDYVYFVPAVESEQYLYVVDDATDQWIRQLPFPYSDQYAIVAPTGDGNHVVAHSYDEANSNQYRLYFFDDVRE